MTNMLQSRSNGERAHILAMYSYNICQTFSSFKIKKKPNTPVTAVAAKAKSNSSSKQTEYKLMVGCCKVGHTIHMEMLSRKDQFIT